MAEKLKASPRIDPEREQRSYGANRVLAGWHNDSRYTTGRNAPRVLSLSGQGSFETLVQTYAPNISVSVVLEEMVRLRAVEKLPTGEVRARASTVAPVALDAPGLDEFGVRIRDYTATLVYNIREPTRPRLAETIMSLEVSPLAIPLLLRSLNEHTRLFLQQVESEMNDPRLRRDRKVEGRTRMGLSPFYFEEELEPSPGSRPGLRTLTSTHDARVRHKPTLKIDRRATAAKPKKKRG